MSVLLIDLDDTLLPDVEARDLVLARVLPDRHSEHTVESALTTIRGAWHQCEARDLPPMAGVSSWEALWTDFSACSLSTSAQSAGQQFQDLTWRQLSPTSVRHQAASAFVSAREAAVVPYSWAADRLRALGLQHSLWCVTNGSSYLQRRKLALSRLAGHFADVFISGEIGDVKSSAAFANRVDGALRAQQDTPICVIGDNAQSDGHLASALGVPFRQVVPGVSF